MAPPIPSTSTVESKKERKGANNGGRKTGEMVEMEALKRVWGKYLERENAIKSNKTEQDGKEESRGAKAGRGREQNP